MIDAPSGGAPNQAPSWDLVDTESCGGGIRVLAPYLIVWGYVGIYRRKEYVSGATGGPRGWRARPPTRRTPYLVGPSGVHRPTSSSYIYPCTPKRSKQEPKPIPPLQLSVSTRSHLGACSGAPPEEGRHHGGLLHHPSPSDEV